MEISEDGAIGSSVLAVLVFLAFVSVRLAPELFVSPLGHGNLVTVLSPGAGGLSTGGSSCPVMSSYGKSPSCSCRSLEFPLVFRHVFVYRLIVLVKRLQLRSCIPDHRTGGRGADDNVQSA